MNVLEERGLFWWHHEPIPERHFAPEASVSGLLKIDEDGLVKLELDGRLSRDKSPMSVLPSQGSNAELAGKSIEGILKASSKHVLLIDLMKQGGRFSSHGMSYEGYAAAHCLVSDHSPPRARKQILSSELEIQLKGFEEWLRLGSITAIRTKSKISAKYARVKDIRYGLGNGNIEVKYHILGPQLGESREDTLELKETVSLVYRPEKPATLGDMRTEFGLFQELFILLTDSEYVLDWPSLRIRLGPKNREYKWYFWRLKTSEEPPKAHECVTNFVQLRDSFGDIVSAWRNKREEFGPGYYLYLGVRRGVKLYAEHRFVNLIWGIEALHRKKKIDEPEAELKVKEKVRRILDKIDVAKDKKWLESRLKTAHEPTLEQRIFDVLSSVPINLEDEKIRMFARRCAELRNDISHFGSQRHGGSYKDFLEELMKMSEALSIVYHMLILHEIGVEEEILKWWIYQGFKSYQNKRSLVDADLLDASVLKPKV